MAEPDPPGRGEAKRLRDLGAVAIDRGAFDEALAAFERASQLYTSPNLRFDMGVALDGLGRLDEAVAAFEAFVDAPNTENDAREYAIARIRELEPSIARLAVTVSPRNATVRIDGRPVQLPLGRDLPVMPGQRLVSAALEDYATEREQLKLVPGQRATVTLTLSHVRRGLEPQPKPQPPIPAPITSPERVDTRPAASLRMSERRPLVRRWWLWTSVGVVTAGLAVGLGVGLSLGRSSGFNPTRPPFGPGARVVAF